MPFLSLPFEAEKIRLLILHESVNVTKDEEYHDRKEKREDVRGEEADEISKSRAERQREKKASEPDSDVRTKGK